MRKRGGIHALARRLAPLSVLAVAAVGLVALPRAAEAAGSTLIDETFNGTTTTTPSWVLPSAYGGVNGACLTASSNTTQTPIPGCGTTTSPAALRLTPNTTTAIGAVAYGGSVPTPQGLVANFDTYQYKSPLGTGSEHAADGIAFFLAAADPTTGEAVSAVGPAGGALGYTPSALTIDGLPHAYLGVGLDVYGNFANPIADGAGCSRPRTNTRTLNDIVIRGPGDGTTGYCMLQNTGNLGAGALDAASPSPVHVEVVINTTPTGVTTASGFEVQSGSYGVKVTPLTGSPQQMSDNLPTEAGGIPEGTMPEGWLDPTTGIPKRLSFGWAGSTGAITQIHEIQSVKVDTIDADAEVPVLAVDLTNDSGGHLFPGATVNYTATASVSDADVTGEITLTDTFPFELTPLHDQIAPPAGWTCGGDGAQTVTCTYDSEPDLGPASNGRPLTAVVGALPALTIPVVVNDNTERAPRSAPRTTREAESVLTPVSDTVTVSALDAVAASDTNTDLYAPATDLVFIGQPNDTETGETMIDADGNPTHVVVAAAAADGTPVPTYDGGDRPVTLGFSVAPAGAHFLNGLGQNVTTLTAPMTGYTADFSPIVIDPQGFGYRLSASDDWFDPGVSSAFIVADAVTPCPAGSSCTTPVETDEDPPANVTSSAQVQGANGDDTVISLTWGGNVAPLFGCATGTGHSNVLTVNGNRAKIITITFNSPAIATERTNRVCFGAPYKFVAAGQKYAKWHPANREYEGLLRWCFKKPNQNAPCVLSINWQPGGPEVVKIFTGPADPRGML